MNKCYEAIGNSVNSSAKQEFLMKDLIRFLSLVGAADPTFNVKLWLTTSKGKPTQPLMLRREGLGRNFPSAVARSGERLTFVRVWWRPDGFRIETVRGEERRRGIHSLRTLWRVLPLWV